jgi:hypothetical protein
MIQNFRKKLFSFGFHPYSSHEIFQINNSSLQAMFGDRRLLLDFPDFVANTWLNLASATWFLTTPQPPKPSMLHVIDGTWIPNR